MKKRFLLVCILIFALTVSLASAQESDTVTVPDITGLGIPEAAAALNLAGLRLGAESAAGVLDPNVTPNTVTAQAITAGESVPRGTAVDITTARANNAIAIYDGNDLTLVNLTGGSLNLNGISFSATDGSATFQASTWGGVLEAGDCGQIWSEPVRSAKDLPECPQSTLWRSTSDRAQHFWIGASGATSFAVFQNGVQRATCQITNPGRCDFFLQGGLAGEELTDYVYMVYTPQHFMVLNRSTNQWMPLGQTLVFGTGIESGGPIVPPNISIFDNAAAILGNPQQLAPRQCISYTNNAPDAEILQACDEIARASLSSATPFFWNAVFTVQGITVEDPATCPAATEGQLTICIVPR